MKNSKSRLLRRGNKKTDNGITSSCTGTGSSCDCNSIGMGTLPLIVCILLGIHLFSEKRSMAGWMKGLQIANMQNMSTFVSSSWGAVTTTSKTQDELAKSDKNFYSPPLQKLSLLQLSRESAQNHQQHHNCTWPFVLIDDRILLQQDQDNANKEETDQFDAWSYQHNKRKIPRILHLTWIHDDPHHGPNKGRCLHHLQAVSIQRWKKLFPNYSIFYHDDYSVAKMMQQEFWPEFPELAKVLQCVKMRNAMLIDIWRQLVLYRFGGLYVDLDEIPTEQFTEDLIPQHVDFFSFSDDNTRPSQWCFATSPGHPATYHSMLTIFQRLLEMPDISRPKLVLMTGPEALKNGYSHTFPSKDRYNEGMHYGIFNATGIKYTRKKAAVCLVNNRNDPFPYNATHNWTVAKQYEADLGAVHWTKAGSHLVDQGRGSCQQHLYEFERRSSRFPGREWIQQSQGRR
ncbi:glycosyltransferase [Seminavis robusta]|uniref:Glycosyltransferase n=1 Tax=Seminavis robusta TaxID=568900 RepID=A0A9N8DJQ1_9STRA|nr:glycosyltransferase [Seminavis robusta]|eukprot:Sro159_g071880.1 glycosyltransferase (456) ;mRNA; f:68459-69956